MYPSFLFLCWNWEFLTEIQKVQYFTQRKVLNYLTTINNKSRFFDTKTKCILSDNCEALFLYLRGRIRFDFKGGNVLCGFYGPLTVVCIVSQLNFSRGS